MRSVSDIEIDDDDGNDDYNDEMMMKMIMYGDVIQCNICVYTMLYRIIQ